MKKNYKKYLLMGLSLVLVSAISIIGTIAFLIDSDSKVNTFTVGDIGVSVTEDTAVIGEGGEVKSNDNGADYTKVMPGDYLKKEVKVANTGTNPAYVAVTVTINNADKINLAIDEFYEGKGYSDDEIQAIYDSIFDGFGMNYKKYDEAGNPLGMRLTITGDDMPEKVMQVDSVKTIDEYALFYKNNWFGEQNDVIPFDGYYTKGMNKYEFKYTYYMLLNAGEETVLFNGLNIPETFNKEQLAMFAGLNIDIKASAIQADNFYGDAKAAFTTLKVDLSGNTNYNVVSNNDSLKTALTKEDNVIVIELDDDVTYDVRPWNDNAMGGANTELIIINGNGHTLTFNQKDSDWNNIVTNGAKLVFNNLKLTNSGYNDGPWNRHNINFDCEVNLNNVTSDKAIAIGKNSALNNVAITDDAGVYGLWIRANDIDVEIDGLKVNAERGIKIADEYIDAPALVNLSVKNAEFNTTKKASILVTSKAGANITLENVDIHNCEADPINAVWVDEDRANYADLVTVSGGKVVTE